MARSGLWDVRSMEGLEASLIDAKVLTLVRDPFEQPVTPTPQKRLSGGRGAVYLRVALAASPLLERRQQS